MEQQLLEIFPDETVTLKDYKSFVNQPERIQISSKDDILSDYEPGAYTSDGQSGTIRNQGSFNNYYRFKVRLPRPALNVKSLQLARASVPNPGLNLQDTECVFWFYTLPKVSSGSIYANNGGAPGAVVYTFDSSGTVYSGGNIVQNAYVFFDVGRFATGYGTGGVQIYEYNITTASTGAQTQVFTDDDPPVLTYFIEYDDPVVASPRIEYLRFVRLAPSWSQREILEANNGDIYEGGINRYFTDYQDLVDELNLSCQDDFVNGWGPLTLNEFGFKWVANIIQFFYNETQNKIFFRGLNTDFTYMPAALDDINWKQAASELFEQDRANAVFNWNVNIALRIYQPYGNNNLNMKLGYTYASYSINPYGPFGPPYPYIKIAQRPYVGQANPIPPFTLYDHIAPGFCDLVFSSCCHIYCDLTGGSTADTVANKSLLGTLPVNTPPLGVAFHSLSLNNPLTKIATEIFEVGIELRTDTGEPFYLGNNAVVSLELILTY